jgi:hypothetical protein
MKEITRKAHYIFGKIRSPNVFVCIESWEKIEKPAPHSILLEENNGHASSVPQCIAKVTAN